MERRRLDAILEAGRYLPFGAPSGCRAVALEAPAVREQFLESLLGAGMGRPAIDRLRSAPLLVALCDASQDGAAGPAAWLAAAQMSLVAEEEGLHSVVLVSPPTMRPPSALSLPTSGRVEAVLAIGPAGGEAEPAAEPLRPAGATAFRATASLPPRAIEGQGDRQVLASFMEIASATAGADDLDALLETIARALGRLFPVDGAALALLEDGAVLVREILRSGEAVPIEPQRLPADAGHLMGWVLENQRPLWRNDIGSELRFTESLPRRGMRSDMTIPLRARGRVMGAFQVACRRRHAFEPEDFETLQRCADLTAVAVETQRLLLTTKRLSEVDGLTGVYNHRFFLGLLAQEVERARLTGRPVALLMIDVDDFKAFNDRHGHPAGDRVLRHVALLVAKVLRRSDVVARYGGEEFVAILPEAGVEAAMAVGEKIRSEIEKAPLGLPGLPHALQVRISLGVAALPEDAGTEGELVDAADRGLYQAKRTGKNRVCHLTA